MKPERWSPPRAPQRARLVSSDPPMSELSLINLPDEGPEDVVFHEGKIFTGTASGSILSIDLLTGVVENLANTGGRPLGLEICADGSLLICDARRGLLRYNETKIEVLVDAIDGVPLNFASNVIEDKVSGTIYFTSSSDRWTLEEFSSDLLEHSGTGRLLKRTPDGEVTVLLGNLQFANGVVMAPDRSSLVIAETGGYRLTRYWLTGPSAGNTEVLVDNLPGLPDNMSVGSDGLIWVALAAPRNKILDALLPRHPILRKIIWRFPEKIKPQADRTVWVVAIDFSGNIIHDLQRSGIDFTMVTSVIEQDGTIVMGSLTESALAVIEMDR